MPSLKIIFLAVICMVVGFLATSAYFGILPQLTQLFTGKIQLIYTQWESLPPLTQKLILAGITIVPTLLAMFFAWAKMKWQQKALQTEQQAYADKTQLTGQTNAAYQEIESLRQEKAQLTQQLQDSNLNQNLQEATQLVAKQRLELTEKIDEIERLRREIVSLSGQIEGMKTKINYVNRIK